MLILFLWVRDRNNHLISNQAHEDEEQQPDQQVPAHLGLQVVKTIGLHLIEECVDEVVVVDLEVLEEEISKKNQEEDMQPETL